MTRRRVLAGVALVVLLLAALGVARLGADRVDAAAAAAGRQAWNEGVSALQAPSALPPSATALHDLGWLHWQQDDVPRALAAWRAARVLSPRDDDLAHDLALARARLEHVPDPVKPSPAWTEIVTPGEVAALATVLWLLASFLTLDWRRGRASALQAVVTSLLAAVATGFALVGRHEQRSAPPAVAVEDAVARDGAALDAGERFTLPPGAEVRAVAVQGGFVLIEDATGRRGWVLADALAVPDPGGLPLRR